MTANLEQSAMYVTATVGGQLFGLPIARVQDVFVPERMTPVPLADNTPEKYDAFLRKETVRQGEIVKLAKQAEPPPAK